MLRNIKKFFNVQFKITECEDDVFSSDSESEEDPAESSIEEKPSTKKSENSTVDFPKTFIFSCIGIGLTNIARKTE